MRRGKKERRTYRVEDAVALWKEIHADYAYNPSIFCADDARTRAAKWVCENRLDAAERVLVYLYAELGSIRDLAQLLGVARSTLADEIKRIKGKVAAELAALEEKKGRYGTDA